MRRHLAASGLLVLTVALAAPAASGFTSVPPGSSVHDDITAIVLHAGWSEQATQALQQAVREPDFHESELDPEGTDLARVDAAEAYRAEHHCDRTPGTQDAAAFEATVAYVHAQRGEAANHSAAGRSDDAVDALGRALHALQDCYSHSNIVDLPDLQRDFEATLLSGTGGAVPGLRLVSYQPGADEPGRPEGDDYPHDDHAKDSADQNDEARRRLADNRTAFEHAVELARLATVAFVQEFVHERPANETAALMAVEEEDQGAPDDVNVPALPMLAVATVLAYVAVAMRMRR